MVIGQVAIPLVGHCLLLGFLFLLKVLFLKIIISAFRLIFFHLINELIINLSLFVPLFVIGESSGDAKYLICVAVLGQHFVVYGVIVLIPVFSVMVHLNFILKIQVGQEVLLICLV